MLRLILNRHPDLALPPESHFIVPLIETYSAHSVLNQADVASACEFIAEHPRFATWRTSQEALTATLSRLREPTLATLVDMAFRLEIAATEKSRWGDKTPEYCSHLDELHELFPKAPFIHIVRDGRDVSNSLRDRTWHGWTEWQRAHYWHRTVSDAEAAGRWIGPGQYLRVSYEELVMSPEPTVKSVCDFLKVDVHPSMFAFYEDAPHHVPDLVEPGGHHEKLRRPPEAADVYRWRRESSALRIMLFEAIAGRTMDQLGMERRFRGASRHLGRLVTALYCPVGWAVTAMQCLYESLPPSMQSSWRQSQLLRDVKRTITRC